ncbi:hypothetical protein M0R72_09275 [Candidatus Pacearchaeota archaeon]|jgi:hypothetical protein|nr:hypothetical protein [Candidatus Pacearchaeota archaeon]
MAYEVKVKDTTSLVPSWVTVAVRKTWNAAQKAFNQAVFEQGKTSYVEVYWVGQDLTRMGNPRSHKHLFHAN